MKFQLILKEGTTVKKAVLKTELQSLLFRNDLQQKELSVNAKIPNSSMNGYVNQDNPVPINKAMDIAEANGDDLFISQMSYKYLGFIKSMDGPLAEICTTAELDIFQKMESEERKERKNRAEVLIVQSKIRNLENFEYDELKQYALEFLDEIIVELAIVFSILKIIGMSIQEAIRIKMPEWIAKKYMKG